METEIQEEEYKCKCGGVYFGWTKIDDNSAMLLCRSCGLDYVTGILIDQSNYYCPCDDPCAEYLIFKIKHGRHSAKLVCCKCGRHSRFLPKTDEEKKEKITTKKTYFGMMLEIPLKIDDPAKLDNVVKDYMAVHYATHSEKTYRRVMICIWQDEPLRKTLRDYFDTIYDCLCRNGVIDSNSVDELTIHLMTEHFKNLIKISISS